MDVDADPRIHVARREAHEFSMQLLWAGVVWGSMGAAILAAMVYFGVSTRWLIVAAFFISVLMSTFLIGSVAERLDAGRAYLEQVCYETDNRLIRGHRDIPA